MSMREDWNPDRVASTEETGVRSSAFLSISLEEVVAGVIEKLASEASIRLAAEIAVKRRVDAMQMLTADEVASLLKLPRARVYKLPVQRLDLGNRTVRFPLHAVEKYIQERTLKAH